MIVLDACMIISFGNAGRLDLLENVQHDRCGVGSRARAEVVRDPAKAALEASISAGRLSVEAISLDDAVEQVSLGKFDDRPAFRGRGDAEVLALAESRGYVIASDERAIRTLAVSLWGAQRVAGSADFLVWAVREGRLSSTDAEQVLSQLDSGPRIRAQLKAQGLTLSDLV